MWNIHNKCLSLENASSALAYTYIKEIKFYCILTTCMSKIPRVEFIDTYMCVSSTLYQCKEQ